MNLPGERVQADAALPCLISRYSDLTVRVSLNGLFFFAHVEQS
jgi:hypothetical protein